MGREKKICVIDFKLGNLFSVLQALKNTGLDAKISSEKKDILDADALVLPGVGAFSDAMQNLNDLNLIQPLLNSVQNGKPLFGICLGLQLLFKESEEFGLSKGLGLIKGRVTRFNSVNKEGIARKVPHIGWNQIQCPDKTNWSSSPLDQTRKDEFMYFVHSFYVEPSEEVTLCETVYDSQRFVSGILKENIFACQFHPEKSGLNGLNIYHRWAKMNSLK